MECRICEKMCPAGAIAWDQKDEVVCSMTGRQYFRRRMPAQ